MSGSDLRRARKRAGLTRTGLAAAIEVTERTIYRWERGDTKILLKHEAAIRAALQKGSR